MTFNELYVHYYEKNMVNKMLLGLSEDELKLVFSKVNSDDYEKVLNNFVFIAEMLARRLSLSEDYYNFIREYIFKHCNEIIKMSSDMQILGYMSTVQNVFSSLCGYESLKGIANYINSKKQHPMGAAFWLSYAKFWKMVSAESGMELSTETTECVPSIKM